MPWGEHKGVRMTDVPADYRLWLFRQAWIRDWPDIHTYLVANQAAFELEDQENDRGGTDGFESLDDYMRYGR